MNFIHKLFIKDYKNTSNSNVRTKYGLLASIIGIISNVILVAFKFIVASIVKSVSLLGDAINNLMDSLSSIINLISFKISNKPADKEHPFGHKRIEYIASLLISVIMVVVAIELFSSSIDKVINPTPTTYSFYLIVVLVVNILIKSFLALFYYDSGKTINSLSLKASYKDSLNDILMTFIIVIGLISSKYIGFNLDGYLGIALSIFILISVFKLIKESIDKLIGEVPSLDLQEKIISYLKSNKNILGVHELLTHQYGNDAIYMSIHVEMDSNLTILESHKIIDELERKVKQKYNVKLLIHVDPVEKNNDFLKEVKKFIDNLLKSIDETIIANDLQSLDGKKILYFDLVLPYGYSNNVVTIINKVTKEIKKAYKYNVSIEIKYK